MAFLPYLFFGRNCRQAFEAYQEVFGGELTLVTTADMPADEQMPGAPADLIMHASLRNGDQTLMGSDDPTAEEFPPVQGMRVAYIAKDAADAQRVFAALADGGDVQLDVGATSFSPMFGMCVDRFGTPWMIDTDVPPS